MLTFITGVLDTSASRHKYDLFLHVQLYILYRTRRCKDLLIEAFARPAQLKNRFQILNG